MAHPRHDLDPALLTPVRLSLMAALSDDLELDFATVRDLLEAEDSVVSKSIAHLEKLGYLRVTKGYAGSRPRTWVASTVKGRRALARHIDALRAITEQTTGPVQGSGPGEEPNSQDSRRAHR